MNQTPSHRRVSVDTAVGTITSGGRNRVGAYLDEDGAETGAVYVQDEACTVLLRGPIHSLTMHQYGKRRGPVLQAFISGAVANSRSCPNREIERGGEAAPGS
jgi:hypothetical protein